MQDVLFVRQFMVGTLGFAVLCLLMVIVLYCLRSKLDAHEPLNERSLPPDWAGLARATGLLNIALQAIGAVASYTNGLGTPWLQFVAIGALSVVWVRGNRALHFFEAEKSHTIAAEHARVLAEKEAEHARLVREADQRIARRLQLSQQLNHAIWLLASVPYTVQMSVAETLTHKRLLDESKALNVYLDPATVESQLAAFVQDVTVFKEQTLQAHASEFCPIPPLQGD